jgi:hypothetical protein
MPHTALLTRIRGEYLEMPGLRLTLEQAQRLWGVERTLCKMMLDALVEAKFLCARPDGVYARANDEGMRRLRTATERLGAGGRIATPS